MKRKPEKPVDEKIRAWLKSELRSSLNEDVEKARLDERNQDIVDRVESDEEPLSRVQRRYIGKEPRRWYSSPLYTLTPGPQEKFKAQQIRLAALLKELLVQECYMSAADAERDVAQELGITVEALRQRFRRELASAKAAVERRRETDLLAQYEFMELRFSFFDPDPPASEISAFRAKMRRAIARGKIE